jgi:hypothetical protein
MYVMDVPLASSWTVAVRYLRIIRLRSIPVNMNILPPKNKDSSDCERETKWQFSLKRHNDFD